MALKWLGCTDLLCQCHRRQNKLYLNHYKGLLFMTKQTRINMLPYNINVPHNIYLILSVKCALSYRISLACLCVLSLTPPSILYTWLSASRDPLTSCTPDTPVPFASLWDVMAVKGGQQDTIDLMGCPGHSLLVTSRIDDSTGKKILLFADLI